MEQVTSSKCSALSSRKINILEGTRKQQTCFRLGVFWPQKKHVPHVSFRLMMFKGHPKHGPSWIQGDKTPSWSQVEEDDLSDCFPPARAWCLSYQREALVTSIGEKRCFFVELLRLLHSTSTVFFSWCFFLLLVLIVFVLVVLVLVFVWPCFCSCDDSLFKMVAMFPCIFKMFKLHKPIRCTRVFFSGCHHSSPPHSPCLLPTQHGVWGRGGRGCSIQEQRRWGGIVNHGASTGTLVHYRKEGNWTISSAQWKTVVPTRWSFPLS